MAIRDAAPPRPLGRRSEVLRPARRLRWLAVLLVAAVASAAVGVTLRGAPGDSGTPAYRFSQTRVDGSSATQTLLSGDGKVIVFLQDGQLWTQPLAGGPKTLVTAGIDGSLSAPPAPPPGTFPDPNTVPNSRSLLLGVSTTGRYIVFSSQAVNLVREGQPPVDPNYPWYAGEPRRVRQAVYVRDAEAGTTQRISPLDHPAFGRVWFSMPELGRTNASFISDRTLFITLGPNRIAPPNGPSPDPWDALSENVLLNLETGTISSIPIPAATGCPGKEAASSVNYCTTSPALGGSGMVIVDHVVGDPGVHSVFALNLSDGSILPLTEGRPYDLAGSGRWALTPGADCRLMLRDAATGGSTAVGVLPNGAQSGSDPDCQTAARAAAVSDDGKTVAFVADPDTSAFGRSSVFIRDVVGGQTYLASTITSGDYFGCPPGSNGSQFDNTTIRNLHLTPAGDALVFESCASNLVGAAPVGLPRRERLLRRTAVDDVRRTPHAIHAAHAPPRRRRPDKTIGGPPP